MTKKKIWKNIFFQGPFNKIGVEERVDRKGRYTGENIPTLGFWGKRPQWLKQSFGSVRTRPSLLERRKK